jgi:hypothetical protein
VVTELEPALGQQPLGLRPRQAGAEHRLVVDLVEGLEAVEAAEVEGDDG